MGFTRQSAPLYQPLSPRTLPQPHTSHPQGSSAACPSITERIRNPGPPPTSHPPPIHSPEALLCPLFPRAACPPAAPGVTATPRKSAPSRATPRSVCKAQGLVSVKPASRPSLGIRCSYLKAGPGPGDSQDPVTRERSQTPQLHGCPLATVQSPYSVLGRPQPKTPGADSGFSSGVYEGPPKNNQESRAHPEYKS